VVRVKLPIGVVERLSLGLVDSPSTPTRARIAEPWRTHRPVPTAVHACSTAVVDPAQAATTVMTCLAEPVEEPSGSDPEGRAVACDFGRRGEVFGCGLVEEAARVELVTVAVGVGGRGSATARGTGCG
jgi:hypothetical protein